ncbi:MAG: 16S rRNA (uracil(1498)-N(3))-methyltransferase [Clostridia bacterium]|nr:16S rRNA (uracil(1498)-N(3))-methyltransferase [Clostridia bacterium]
MRRFFAETSGDKVIISGLDAHHITDVLRLKEGDEIIVCGGDGLDCITRLTSLSKDEVLGEITKRTPSTAEPSVKIKLFQCLPKGDKFEYIIQKTVELGVTEIIPVASSRCIVKIPANKAASKTDRWNKIAESAAKQSGRGIIPEVCAPMDFKDAVKVFEDCDLPIVCYELETEVSLKKLLTANSDSKTVNIFIGPEGGISDEEIASFKRAGANSVTLGPRILRTETAPLAVLSNIIYQLEDR